MTQPLRPSHLDPLHQRRLTFDALLGPLLNVVDGRDAPPGLLAWGIQMDKF